MSNISLEDRKNYVGASEVADLFGVGFKSRWQLWLEKAGRIEPEDLSQNENIQAGKFLEPAIAAWASDKWDMKLRKVRRYIAHPYIKGLGASLDYESQEGSLIPVEIKWSQARDGWDFDGDLLTDAPLNYLLQIQAQLACTGAPYGWLIVLLNGKLKRMRVDMHRDTVNRIEHEVAQFWTSVEQGKEPKPDFAYDGGVIARLMQVTAGTVVDLTSHNQLPVLCGDYLAAADAAKDATARKDAALAEIRTILGEHGSPAKALLNGFTVSSSMVPETQINFTRKAYALTRIAAKKEKAS